MTHLGRHLTQEHKDKLAISHQGPLARAYKDGRTAHPHYQRWANIVNRCERAADSSYSDYGGRGITICREWRENPWSFFQYLETLGEQDGRTLGRIDNDGNYEPGNIRWETRSEQNLNRRRRVSR